MRAFYQRLVPFRYLFQWLNHSASPSNDFAYREFAFTLPNDAYLRYQSFVSADLLRKQCMQLIPSRFEIGPVYSTNPRDRKTLRKASMFRPISKELVFDVDMTDYDSIRTCCQGASICGRCWSFITMAIKVVDAALREDFGFKHVLWVYSGRRGAHAWVCDRRARDMDDAKRRAVAGYLEVLRGGDKGGKKVNVKRPLHPHLDRSLRLLRDHFQADILLDQDPWRADDRFAALLALLPDAELAAALRRADAVVLPYLRIDNSGVLAAALAFAAPLVLSDVGGFGELHRRDGVGELVRAGDAAGLAAALARVLGDDDLRAALRERSAAAASGPLSWAAVAERTEDVYREVAR